MGKGDKNHINKHRHQREPVSDPTGRAVPWWRRCPCVPRTGPCTFSHHDGVEHNKHQTEHSTVSLVSAFATSCCVRDRYLLHPSFRRRHRLHLCFTRGRTHQYMRWALGTASRSGSSGDLGISQKLKVSFTLLPWAGKMR